MTELETKYHASYITPFVLIGIPFVIMIIGYLKPKSEYAKEMRSWGCGCFTVGFIFVTMTLPSNVRALEKQYEAEVKTGCAAIRSAHYRYADDHDGTYPEHIEQLVAEKYMDSFENNPFLDEPMRPVNFNSHDYKGNFTYVPVVKDGKVTDYYLFCYGYEESRPMDINADGVDDHVILTLTSYDGSRNIPDGELANLLSTVKTDIN